MADTSFVDESAATLSASLIRPGTVEDARQRAVRRGGAVVAVAVLHVLFVFMLIEASWIPSLRTKPPAQAPLLWLLLPKAPGVPKAPQQRSQKEVTQEPPAFHSLPITLPPRPDAIDLGLALGRALACGANSFEYLTPEGRAGCRHPPWNFTYARDGTIILDTQYKRPEPKPTPAEVLAHERYTADPCLAAKAAGTECIDKIIFGDRSP